MTRTEGNDIGRHNYGILPTLSAQIKERPAKVVALAETTPLQAQRAQAYHILPCHSFLPSGVLKTPVSIVRSNRTHLSIDQLTMKN